MDANDRLDAATFTEIHQAVIEAVATYERLKDDEEMGCVLCHYANNLSDMALKKIGFEGEDKEELEEKPRKKSSREWNPEQRAAAAERLRGRQAAKKAAREAERGEA